MGVDEVRPTWKKQFFEKDMTTRVDLHVHSKYSNRPSEWFLRRIGAPESYVEPLEIYRKAKSSGMDYVTITDHNKIEGALEISHLADTFLSCELTTYFPEVPAKLHILVYDISEKQFAELSYLRKNVYDLKGYIDRERIIHSVAHPLFRVDDRLDREHLEKLLLLFTHFEAINGSRDPRAADLFKLICSSLTPQLIDDLSAKHDLLPIGYKPWLKTFTGGSDDHSGSFIATAWTETSAGENLSEYLINIANGRCFPGGSSGNSLKLAHSFYKIAYSYYKDRFGVDKKISNDLLGAFLQNLLSPNDDKPKSWPSRYKLFVDKICWAGKKRQFSPIERVIVDEIGQLFTRSLNSALDDQLAQERSFAASCKICHHLSWRFVEQFLRHLRHGNLFDALQTITALGPVALAIAPYLAAFSTQHKDDLFLKELATELDLPQTSPRSVVVAGRKLRPQLNGIINTSCDSIAAAGEFYSVVTMTCDPNQAENDPDIVNFKPVSYVKLGKGAAFELPLPPFLEVFRSLEELQAERVIVSIPNSMGIAVLAGAHLLNIKSTFLYQRSFIKTSQRLWHESDLGRLLERFIDWSASLADLIIVDNKHDKQHLVSKGIAPEKIVFNRNSCRLQKSAAAA
ncbi:MAG: hypothetical protein U9N63_10680 [Pseudomonadota bacterium]|nr:hypothetical protein [Pseudomonadota bacterium]